MIGLLILSTALPRISDYALLKLLTTFALTVCASATICIVVTGYWMQLTNQKWEPSGSEIARTGHVCLMIYVYWIVVTIGLRTSSAGHYNGRQGVLSGGPGLPGKTQVD